MQRPLGNTTSTQRDPYYEDIEALITVGFLSHPVVVNGVHMSLRSLGPGDLFLLRTRLAGHGGGDWKMWSIASAVWMVDGVLLLNEPHAASTVLKIVRGIPKRAQNILLSIVFGLFSRQTKALSGVESYCYEGTSRFRWKSYGGTTPNYHSGIPGQETLGTNYIQRMWTFYNQIEDQRIADESVWEGMKLVASAQSPKGVKKIDTHDKEVWQKEQERRQKVQDRFYYIATGVYSPEDEEAQVKADPLASKSPDELEQEMHSWVSGKEDAHDRIVNGYKQQVIARHEAQKAKREQQAAEFRRQLSSTEESAQPRALVGYTQEQLAEILRLKQPGVPGVKTVFPDGGHEDYVYTKFLEKVPDSDGLIATSDGRLIQGKRDLSEQVSGRQVPFDTRQEE